MNTREFYMGRARLALLASLALAFVAVGIAILMHLGPEPVSWEVIVAGYLNILFFGGCLIYIVSRLATARRPALVIEERGIIDNASAIGAGLISWDNIADARIYEFMGQKFLGISLNNAEDVLARMPTLKRWVSRANKGLVDAPVNIPQSALSEPLESVLVCILERLKNRS